MTFFSLLRRTLEHQNLLREVLYLRDLHAEGDRYLVVGHSPQDASDLRPDRTRC